MGVRSAAHRRTVLAALLLLAACAPPPEASSTGASSGATTETARRTAGSSAPSPTSSPASTPRTASARLPAHGSDSTLDVASWNIEWFGDPTHDPSNDRLQRDNVRDIVLGTDADIWGVAEVVDAGEWKRLKESLPEYDGFLANEGPVTSRASYYRPSEQKVGVLYKRSVARLLDAKVILPQNDNDFAGRPPLQVRLRVTIRGQSDELVLIVVHMKATADEGSWMRRARAATALKRYVDDNWSTARVLVVGDWNDDVDRSLTRGKPSPYALFADDAAHYRFLTATLSARGISSTASHQEMIDHHLASRALAQMEVANSAEVYRVDQFVQNYRRTTSDHFPVISHFKLAH